VCDNGQLEACVSQAEEQGDAAAEKVQTLARAAAAAEAKAQPPDADADADAGAEVATTPAPGADPFAAAKKKAWENIARRDGKQVVVSKAAGGDWAKFKSYAVWQRTYEIWSFAILFVIKRVLIGQKWTYDKKKGGMTPDAQAERRRALAVWLKEGLLRLGPTFIKIGQQFSTRVDVLEKEFTEQLSELQDKVPPFDSDTVVSIIESEFGVPVSEKYEYFDTQPLAAASLGQVHLAKLNGETVIVKVQRPGLKELFDIDLVNIRAIAKWLNKTDPKTDGAARDWVAIYDETARVLYEEIDYEKEADNAERFKKNFAEFDYVKVPEIIRSHTNSQVLTMEYCPSVKITNVEKIDEMGLDRRQIARYAVESYLQQILTFGFFHADPHPGNLGVNKEGKIVVYDYGMMGSIPGGVRGGLLECFYGVYEDNPSRVVDSLEKMGVLVPGKDRMAVTRTARFFLGSFRDRLKTQKTERAEDEREFTERGFKEQRSKDEKQAVRKKILSNIGEDLLSVAADQPFRFPAEFTFVVRAFSVLDGVGKSLDPRFDISEIARPYAEDLLGLSKQGAASEVLKRDVVKRWQRQNEAFVNLFQGPDKIAYMEDTLRRMESGDLKLRVRNLEAERAFKRVAQVQDLQLKALLAATLVNVYVSLKTAAVQAIYQQMTFFAGSVFGLLTLVSAIKVKALDKKELKYRGVEQ
jgi:predicted unusual protein kinase regulating ubiquinone biosynthesis (AarF/ABC1/UbiB family)